MMEDSTNRGVRNGRFYILIAVASTLLVFAGFARSYYLRSAFGFPALPGLLHLHGLVMTLWFVLFLLQAWLISVQRTRLHRQLGVFGIGLAALMVAVTATVVITAARRGFTAFPETVQWPGFLLLSLGIVMTFAVLFFAAVWLRRRSAPHKRLMVLASLSIWGPRDHPPSPSLHRSGKPVDEHRRGRRLRVDVRGCRHRPKPQTGPCFSLGRAPDS